MFVIGLTGGIACGKSTVSAMLRKLGAVIVDADVIARQVVEPHMPAWEQIVKEFGASVVRPDGQLDREALGERIFADEKARRRLEDITHPCIKQECLAQLKQAEQAGVAAAVLDVPLLLESGWQTIVDEVWVVYSCPAVQLDRLMARNGLSAAQARARLAAQMSPQEKVKLADLVIDNSHTLEETKERVEAVWARLQERLRSHGLQ